MVSLLVSLAARRPADTPSLFLSLPPPSSALNLRFFLFEANFVAILLYAVPVGAHGTVVSISIGNLFAVARFWYNPVRCVDVTAEDGLRSWIGNIELNVPYDKITDPTGSTERVGCAPRAYSRTGGCCHTQPTGWRCSRGSRGGR